MCPYSEKDLENKRHIYKTKFLCLTKHQVMKTYWGSGCIAPHILDPGTSWR